MIPHSLRGFFFLQNGPGATGMTSPLDGRGHVTCVDLETRRVTEVRVPASDHVVTLDDIMKRPWRVVLNSMLFGQRVHGGTCNTAVIPYRGRWHAVEEASFAYALRFDGSGIGRGHFSRTKLPAHSAPGVRSFHYLASARRYPLTINGMPVMGWSPPQHERPFVVHSCGRVDNLLVFPIMSTRFGNYDAWLDGSGGLPLHSANSSGWLVYDQQTGDTAEVMTEKPTDVFHVAAVRREGDARLAIFANHVSGFLEFAQNESSPLHFSFQKHVVDLEAREVVAIEEYPDAAGDFPNTVDSNRDLVLLNRMGPDSRSEIVLFDLASERVVDTVTLPHKTGDVLSRDGVHLVYATTDQVVVYDRLQRRVHSSYPIPPRARNFHAALLRAPAA